MCLVSAVMEYGNQAIQNAYPWTQSYPNYYKYGLGTPDVPKEEFDALKKEVQELKQVIIAAKLYDSVTNQPDCEMEEKVAAIKKIAELVGVELNL